MENYVEGTIINVLPMQSGTSKAGKEWKKQEFVIDTGGNYPKQICFSLFNQKIDQYPIKLGYRIRVFFELESREYNGRYYTQVNGWKIEMADAVQQSQAPSAPQPQQSQAPSHLSEQQIQEMLSGNGTTDDLPW